MRTAQPHLDRRDITRPLPLPDYQQEVDRLHQRDPFAVQAFDPREIGMPGKICDRVEALGTHGLRRKDQTRVEAEVMIAAIAVRARGSKRIMGHLHLMELPVPCLFQVGNS